MILYRDLRRPRPTAFRAPPHLADAAGLARREATAGDLLALVDPMYLDEPPAGTAWHAIDDDFAVCLVGPLDQATLNRQLRQQPVAIPTAAVQDAAGRTWIVPRILGAAGALLLPVPWGTDPVTGQWARVPTAVQATWIAAAQTARGEILAAAERCAGGEIVLDLPIDVAARLTSTLCTATYHLSPQVIQRLALLDDRLSIGALVHAAGVAGLAA
jgi:hypothetical protein